MKVIAYATVILAQCVIVHGAFAQATGVLNKSVARSRSLAAEEPTSQLARLLVDPSLSNPVRASAWSAALTASSTSSEAKIQINLADIMKSASDSLSSLALAIIAPLNKDDDFTELANLDGLVGTTRGEFAWTRGIADGDARQVKLFVTATGAAPRFEFRTAPGLVKSETRKPAYSVAGGVARIGQQTVLRLGYRYEDKYTAPDEQSICTPISVGIAGATACEHMVIGPPTQSRKNVVEGEFRWLTGKYFSTSLVARHDFSESVWGFDLPLWVIPDGEGNLGGGFRIG